MYGRIRAIAGGVGRAPIDPAILVSLWVYATLDGAGSAREFARLCDSDDAYRWIYGGVGVNHHTLGDFRVAHPQSLDDQLSHTVAALLSQELVSMNRMAHDGMRVRAHAGAASFRRRETLEDLLQDARHQVQALKHEVGDDPGAGARRVRAARQRAAEERVQRIGRALKAMDDIDKSMARRSKTGQAGTPPADASAEHATPPTEATVVSQAPAKEGVRAEHVSDAPAAAEQPKAAEPPKKVKEPRMSTTDHEAQVMKMPDGGFRPAFNAQIAVDTETLIITGVDLINSGSDVNQMLPMHQQHQDRYGRVPPEWLTDGSFAKHDHIDQFDARNSEVFAPVAAPQRVGYTERHRRSDGASGFYTDLTDAEGHLVADLFERQGGRGAPPTHERRVIVDACCYVVKTGCAWRLLPKVFPPWRAVYKAFRTWAQAGTFEAMHDRLRQQWRERIGRDPEPTAAIIDAQSTRSTAQGGDTGFDAGKKVKGRKRHIVVDTLGLLLAVTVPLPACRIATLPQTWSPLRASRSRV